MALPMLLLFNHRDGVACFCCLQCLCLLRLRGNKQDERPFHCVLERWPHSLQVLSIIMTNIKGRIKAEHRNELRRTIGVRSYSVVCTKEKMQELRRQVEEMQEQMRSMKSVHDAKLRRVRREACEEREAFQKRSADNMQAEDAVPSSSRRASKRVMGLHQTAHLSEETCFLMRAHKKVEGEGRE